MKALVFNNVGDITLETVKDPTIQNPKDVIVRITTSAICGTDLHMIRGTMPGVKKGTILGHEGIGIVQEVGSDVLSFKIGDRVIIPSTIACGSCHYCLLQIYAQCNKANPNGSNSGTAFFGGPKESGPFNGMQAEKVRVPFGDFNLIKLPEEITDDQGILLSDILPTAYMAVENANVEPSDIVAVFGCGPVGQLVIACLKKRNVQNIIAIDSVPARLQMAKNQNSLTINFNEKDPISELKKLTNNLGPSKVIDAVGIDAQKPKGGTFSFLKNIFKYSQFKKELKQVAPQTNPHDGNWYPGDAPSQVLQWAVKSIAKAGTFSIIGVYPKTLKSFPIGEAFNKNITIRMGNCNHAKYIPELMQWIVDDTFNPLPFITQKVPFHQIIDAYKHFDRHDDSWIKVVLKVH